MRKLLLATVAAAAVSAASMADAAPMLSYQILDGATLIGAGSSSAGLIALSGADGNFQINGNGTGAPLLTSPNFSTNNFSTTFNGAAGIITIRVTNTGLIGFTTGTVMNTFTLNSLTGPSFTSGTIANYFDNTNTAFGTGTLLATSTFTGQNSFSSTQGTLAAPAATFSETTIYTLNFAAGTAGSISASSQLIALPTSVPEPASLAILGASLAGIGFVRRRRA